VILAEARADVVWACRRMRATGLVPGTAGNVSVRVDDLVAISPSGLDYDELTAELVCVYALDGTPVDAPLKPSSELPLHLALRQRPGAVAVVHTHAVASTALSLVVDEVPASHYYTAMFGGPVRVAGYATFGSPELAANVVAALADRTAALMANHGAVCVAGSVRAALDLASYLEYVCDVQLRAESTGRPVRTLAGDEIDRVRDLLRGYGQPALLARHDHPEDEVDDELRPGQQTG
jgi:L-fuculose-phosphate aldolase